MPRWAPEPPVPLPPGCVVHVPGRGEMFLRDSGGDGPPVLLLHGWMFSADLNWYRTYGPLAEAGYRVLAVDHRGHGRGLRTPEPFTLKACADDAAALVAHLKIPPVLAVGYSMGGPIASLIARDHPQLVSGVVLGATAMDWSGRRMRTFWRTMAGCGSRMGLAPESLWQRGLRAGGFPESRDHDLDRGGAQPRQLGRHRRGRPRARPLRLARLDRRPRRARRRVVTTQDTGVPPAKQRALAAAMSAPTSRSTATTPRSITRATSSTPSCSRRSTSCATRGPPPAR